MLYTFVVFNTPPDPSQAFRGRFLIDLYNIRI